MLSELSITNCPSPTGPTQHIIGRAERRAGPNGNLVHRGSYEAILSDETHTCLLEDLALII
jgi:hypothetical protein